MIMETINEPYWHTDVPVEFGKYLGHIDFGERGKSNAILTWRENGWNCGDEVTVIAWHKIPEYEGEK